MIERVERELDRFGMMGWEPWRPVLACLDCLLGREIILRSGGVEFQGQAAGIDENGGLLLENPAGEQAVFSAVDVHLVTDGRSPPGPGRNDP